MAGPAMAPAASAATPSSAELVPVIVQEQEGTGNGPERAVEAFGGSVTQQFSVFQGFSAKLPADRFDALRAVPGVAAVTQDATLTLNGLSDTLGGLGKVTQQVTSTTNQATSTVTAPVTSTVTAPVTSTVTNTVTAPVTDTVTQVAADTTTAVADVAENTVADVAEVAEDTVADVAEVAEDTTTAVSDVVEDTVAAVGDVAAQAAQAGSLYTLANEVTGASAMWDAGYTGQGVDVAVIDSGTVPVEGLDDPSRLVYGPDLSFEAGTPVENLDTHGHGTAMASIIAGHDADATAPYSGDSDSYVGMAPDARIVSIKVADALGRTDVSQAIAAIDWVTEHGQENGLNIRVLNMSFGTDGVQDYLLDPLAYAAEQAWHKGVVAVVAVGNEGFGTQKVNNPAYDPYVLAVGSADTKGTATTADDTASAFSNDGDGTRNPDLVAPGEHVVSLRSPNSFLDQEHPAARIGDRLFRGSGTSQAAAVVSGAAALLISQRPDITPDEVKALLMGSAQEIPGASDSRQGSGLLDLATAMNTPTPENAVQNHKRSTGSGSLESARGSVHVEVDGDKVTGEVDVTGTDIEDSSAETIAEGVTEQQAAPAGQPELSGVSWSGVSWSGVSWSGVSWSGVSWS